MSRPPYPHKCKGSMDGSTIFHAWTCRCGARPDVYSAETARDGWGEDCPAALRERIAEQDRHISSLDCRFAGHFAELSGKHCPPGQPCDRCEAEAMVERAEAERDATRRDLAALRDYLTRSVADDIAVHDAWDILNALAPEDLARVLKWADEIDGRPKKPVQIPAVLFHRLLSAGLKAAEGDVLEWITARVERCAEVESEAHRLRDLVRHQRGPLHDADLITDEEYAALAADAGAVARLLGYDEMRRELAELRTFGASIHKAVAAAMEARAKELDIAADTQDAYTEGPDDTVRVATLRRAASIVRGGR